MDAKLIALKLFLDSMGVSSSINTVDDRKRVQKAVYLAQVAGADLGYRFGWYLMGPYSSSLTEDYYAMDAKAAELENEVKNQRLHESYQAILHEVRVDIKKPNEVVLSDEQWLELLASYHFLRRVSHLSHEQAKDQIAKQKALLHPWLEHAVRAIESSAKLRIPA